jgi:hypothetical protein
MKISSRSHPPLSLPTPGVSSRVLSRRTFGHSLLGSMALPLVPAAASLAGCATLIGEQTLEGYFYVGKDGSTKFFGWTEVNLGQEAGPDDAAAIRYASLQAPEGTKDLTFLTTITCEAVVPTGERTLLMKGQNFPKNDTIGPLEIVYTDNLRPFFPDGKKIRVEWKGTVDGTFPYPAGGLRVDAYVTIELL